MQLKNILKLTYRNLKERKLRSTLTFLSIAVGIAGIVSLIIISQSMEHAVSERLRGTADVIRVVPGHVVPGRDFVPYGSFSSDDLTLVKNIDGVADVSSWMVEIAEIKYNDKLAPVEIMGGHPADVERFLGKVVKLTEGRMIKEGADREAIISTSTLEHVNRWLGANIKVGDSFTLNGLDFTLVGLMAYDLAGVEVSHRMLVSKKAVIDTTQSQDIMLMLVRAENLDDIRALTEVIEEALDNKHGVEGLTTAIATEAVLDGVALVSRTIQAVVVGIASIALLSGAIGIINTMLMSVLERTHEIGIMKATGATNKNILHIFIVESSIISFIGGALGVLIGVIISYLINVVISQFLLTNMQIIINPQVIFGGLLLALVVGILGGLYPARRASSMNPAEALRSS
ncbi:MAG: ABC transporter permease [Alkaliphilus sp.]